MMGLIFYGQLFSRCMHVNVRDILMSDIQIRKGAHHDRVAGAYMTADGEIDDTFNIHFLKLSGSEMKRNLDLTKEIPFARTNDQLKEYRIPEGLKGKDSIYQLLDAIKACGLKNDALMEVLYELITG